ncbi:ABC transporter permease [Paenibacillus psychroresistens]|nr:ABC transporter permease [Paenibacillus psychroresistens]
MLTPAKLFLKRLAAHGAFQWSVLRLVVDWIIALYFIVPAFVILGFQYHSWWDHAPVWIEKIPYYIIVIILYRIATMGTVRLFVEEADQLFLLQHSKWIPRLKRLGMAYSFIFHLVFSAAIVALLAPLLVVHYLLTPGQLIMLFFYMVIFRNLSAFIKHFLSLRYSSWRYLLATIGLQLVMTTIFVYTVLTMKLELFLWSGEVLVFALLTYLSMKYRLHLKGTFARDVEHEQTQRLKFIALLLRRNVTRKPKTQKVKPFFFSQSNLIFKQRNPVNGLVELYLKSFVRSGVQMRLYLQFLAVGMGLMALPILPKTIKIVLWLVLSIFFCNWLKVYWYEVLDSPFVQMFSWKDIDRQSAAQKGIFYAVLPGYSLIGLTLGITSLTWSGTLSILLFGGAIVYMMTNIIITMTFKKQA